jgi:crotonobetainyl-CoA:carnitine CoA-transferase CaiB-like acyl-CoA transferase
VSGTLLLQDDPDQDPLKLPGNVGLCFIGNMAAVGALAAVTAAKGGSCGVLVDCAAVEVLATMPSRASTLLGYQYRNGRPRPPNDTSDAQTLMPRGIFPCLDGHVAILTTVQQLPKMIEVLGDDALKEAFASADAFERGETRELIDAALYPWLLGHTRAEATAKAQAAGWAVTGVFSPEELLSSDHLHQRGFWVHSDDPAHGVVDLPGPPVRFAEGGWALRRLAPVPSETSGGNAECDGLVPASVSRERPTNRAARPTEGVPPLRGTRIVDMTTVWAGPYATMLLADLGAEVIRVENPWIMPPATKGYQPRPAISNLGFLGSGYGPAEPSCPDRPYNRLAMNNSICRNKLACTIDTRRPEGRELLMRLATKADVFIENFKAQGLAHMGIQVSELQSRNPRLIVLRLPPFGATGDWASFAGFGAQIDGSSGLAWLMGHRGSDPVTSPSTTYMDAATGPAAALATLAALRYRAVTGRGQLIELAQIENVLQHLGDIFVDAQIGIRPGRMGNRDRRWAPQGLYPCRGIRQWIAISVATEEEWRSFADALGRLDLVADPRFANVHARHANHDDLDDFISAWTITRDSTEAFHLLQAAGVAAGPLLNDEGFSIDPQLHARRWLRPLTSRDVGTHLYPGLPYHGVPQEWWRGSPGLGEDNAYVYKEIIRVSDEEYEQFAADKILAEDYLDPSGSPY